MRGGSIYFPIMLCICFCAVINDLTKKQQFRMPPQDPTINDRQQQQRTSRKFENRVLVLINYDIHLKGTEQLGD